MQPLSRRFRVLTAFVSLLAGWLVAGSAALGFEGLAVDGRVVSADMLLFVLIIGLFAAVGWAVSVLPLVLLGDHGAWPFEPQLAPLVGALCGCALLLVEMWVFFDSPPWEALTAPFEAGSGYLLILAGITGATTWSVYTRWVRRLARKRESFPV
jgi:hypothetical protein